MTPLVATTRRWMILTAVAAGVGVLFARFIPASIAAEQARVLVGASIAACASVVGFLHLRGEDARLTRELRATRTATSVMREQMIRRRRGGPMWSRWLSPTLGTAALALAEGDTSAAQALRDANPAFFGFGEAGRLREVVDADLVRSRGGTAALEESIATLLRIAPLAHQEAERYRLHVLVKAVLEQGDVAIARDLVDQLLERALTDEEVRVYVVWLRAWFDMEHVAAPSEAEVRLALLVARSHGADELVKKLLPP